MFGMPIAATASLNAVWGMGTLAGLLVAGFWLGPKLCKLTSARLGCQLMVVTLLLLLLAGLTARVPVLQAVMLLFGLARGPALASLAMCLVRSGDCLHNSGYNVNYLEVGGKDTAALSAVGNCLASAPGFIIPPLSLAMRRICGGSWLGVFIVTVVLQVVSAAAYMKFASLVPARDALA